MSTPNKKKRKRVIVHLKWGVMPFCSPSLYVDDERMTNDKEVVTCKRCAAMIGIQPEDGK